LSPAASLSDYDPSWRARFEEESRRIATALAPIVVQIEHVDSTAVPGLAAKPTIDIAVGATTIDVSPDVVARMEALG
jgi:GrpB-like predicted nucleotidyltransferase (UPF0157 family)